MRLFVVLLGVLAVMSCSTVDKKNTTTYPYAVLNLAEANRLAQLPLHCVETEYPNKLNQTVGSDADLQSPQILHPTFYGCFDWHSAVHGYWSIVSLLKSFPDLNEATQMRALLERNITPAKIAREVAYFEGKLNQSWERTYGWAWLLKLAEELHTWDDPLARQIENNLQPLTTVIVERFTAFLPKLYYPIRVGEHPNTAFGLSFAYDYATTVNNRDFVALIEKRALDFYADDKGCPMDWEPGGFDFLSPCLQEMDIMRKVLKPQAFESWLVQFLPELSDPDYDLPVGIVSDRTDGKLVHLDGVNFSRAWCLYGVGFNYPAYRHLLNVANKHVQYSLPNLVGDSYEGGHWLASFAIFALNQLDQKSLD